MLKLEKVEIGIGETRLLAIDAAIATGEILTVMGPSGSGKSTLLGYIAGFLSPPFHAAGRIVIDGDDVTATKPEERRVGLMFQDPMLFPHLSVSGNLGFALPAHLRDREERIATALRNVGLEGFERRDPGTLSGGQKSRVALMRTLLAEPRVLLMDEPFAKLDRKRKDEVRDLAFATVRQSGLPAIVVSHDEGDARAAAGPVIELAG